MSVRTALRFMEAMPVPPSVAEICRIDVMDDNNYAI